MMVLVAVLVVAINGGDVVVVVVWLPLKERGDVSQH